MSKWAKRALSVLLACLLVGGALPMISVLPVVASGTGYGSNGKFLAPIEPWATDSTAISTRAQLEAIANNLSGKYHLTKDIDLSGTEWVPIGDSDTPFTGTFDGQGHVIRNLRITGEGYEHNGLFGYVHLSQGGIIKNIALENVYINVTCSTYLYFRHYAGGISGYFRGGTVDNCYTTGTISFSTNTSNLYVGGILGAFGGRITNSYNTCNISASGEKISAEVTAGGIVGIDSSYNNIENCYNTGDVIATATGLYDSAGRAYAGGIGGYTASPKNCFNTGDVRASASGPTGSAWTIAGGITSWGSGHYCYNTGTISVSNFSPEPILQAGGVAGIGYATDNCYNKGDIVVVTSSNPVIGEIGGILGGSSGNIGDCYNTGSISITGTSLADVGGICARKSSFNTIANCYAENLYGSEYGAQLTVSQMKNQAYFNDWDFETVWDIEAFTNNGNPFLRNMPGGKPEEPEKPENPELPKLRYDKFEADWDESLFSTDPNTTSYAGSPKWKELAIVSSLLSGLVYGSNSNGIYGAFDTIGIDSTSRKYYNQESKFLQPGYAFGHKKIMRNGVERTLVVAVFRGTSNWSDIGTDISQAVSGINSAAKTAKENLDAYLATFGLAKYNITFLITGHSLGGGMANCVANTLSGEVNDNDVFAFTFASPKTAFWKLSSYDNISNFISPTDFTPKLGPGYPLYPLFSGHHYGRNYYVITPESRYQFGECHAILSYIQGVKDMVYKGLNPKTYSGALIECPVDVEVYNSNNVLVGKIVNNIVTDNTKVQAYVDGDQKYVFLPSDEKFTLKLTATDKGIMDYTVFSYDYEIDETQDTKFSNIILQDGKAFTSEVGNSDMTDIKLLVLDANGNPVREVLSDGTEVPYSVRKYVGLFRWRTNYEANFRNWFMFIFMFGWLWMWFI